MQTRPRATEIGLTFDHARGARLLAWIALAWFATVVIRTAWMSDEALLAVRTAQNIVNGSGPRWNVVERVQAYTAPLWVLILACTFAVTREWYLTTLAISLVASACAVSLVVFVIAADVPIGIVAALALTFSKAFVEYSTSGFEMPLTCLLLAGFWAVHVRRPGATGWMAVLAGLCLLSDAFAALLLLPSLVMAAWKTPAAAARARATLCLLLPVVLWSIFATLYYGFPLPAPAYARWHGLDGVGADLQQGVAYLLDATNADPITILLIGIGLFLPAIVRTEGAGEAAAGLVLYLVALVLVGGDPMSGRALAAPLLLSICVLARISWEWRPGLIAAPIVAVILVGLVSPESPVRSDDTFGTDRTGAIGRITDERRVWYQWTGLLKAQRYLPDPDTDPARRDIGDAIAAGHRAIAREYVGLPGMIAGPGIDIVDLQGRADALLSGMPPDQSQPGPSLRGPRVVPAGYLDTLEGGRNVIADPYVAAYYDKLAQVTRGPIFDRARLAMLVDLNLHESPSMAFTR